MNKTNYEKAYEALKEWAANYKERYKRKMSFEESMYFLSGWFGNQNIHLHEVVQFMKKLQDEDIIQDRY